MDHFSLKDGLTHATSGGESVEADSANVSGSARQQAEPVTEQSEMIAAVGAAKRSMRQFLAAFHNPAPHQTGFHLKVAFEVSHETEQIWLCDIDLNHGMPTGVVAEATDLPGFIVGQRVPFETIRIVDWMYSDDNAMIGGFTTRAAMKMRLKHAFVNRLSACSSEIVH